MHSIERGSSATGMGDGKDDKTFAGLFRHGGESGQARSSDRLADVGQLWKVRRGSHEVESRLSSRGSCRRRFPGVQSLGFALLLAGCQESATAPGEFPDLSGTYLSQMEGENQGVVMLADFTLDLTQESDQLAGTWALSAQFFLGDSEFTVSGTRNLTGTVTYGDPAPVSITIVTSCTGYEALFTGTFNQSTGVLALAGPIEFLNEDCEVMLSYPAELEFHR